MRPLPNFVSAEEYFRALEGAGIISSADQVESVSVVAERGHPVSVVVHILPADPIPLLPIDMSWPS